MQAGVKTALDLASFEVVRAFRQPLLQLLEAHRPDFLICNEVRHSWPLWRLAPLMHSIMPMACSTAPHQPAMPPQECCNAKHSCMRSVVQGHCRQRFANIFTCYHEQDEALEIIGGLEPGRTPEQALEFLAARADIAVVTLGERGCILRSAETDGVLSEPAASGVTVADATGGRHQKIFPPDFPGFREDVTADDMLLEPAASASWSRMPQVGAGAAFGQLYVSRE